MNRGYFGLTHSVVPARLRSLEGILPPDHPDTTARVRRCPPSADRAGGVVDHFDSRRRPLNWTISRTNVATFDINRTWKSHVYARFSAASGAFSLTLPWAPSGDFSVTAKLRWSPSVQTGAEGLLNARQDASNNIYTKWSNFGGSSNVNMLSQVGGGFTDRGSSFPMWGDAGIIHLQRIGTTWGTWYSPDGYHFRRTTTFSQAFTITSIALTVNAGSGGYAGEEAGIDWIGLNWKLFA